MVESMVVMRVSPWVARTDVLTVSQKAEHWAEKMVVHWVELLVDEMAVQLAEQMVVCLVGQTAG